VELAGSKPRAKPGLWLNAQSILSKLYGYPLIQFSTFNRGISIKCFILPVTRTILC